MIKKMITKPVIYTEEFVKEEVQKLLEEARNSDMVILGELFENKDYSAQRFSEWATNFESCQDISESIKKIKELFENRVNIGGLTNKLNAAMSIFNLKNNYGYKDRSEVDQNIKGTLSLTDLFKKASE